MGASVRKAHQSRKIPISDRSHHKGPWRLSSKGIGPSDREASRLPCRELSTFYSVVELQLTRQLSNTPESALSASTASFLTSLAVNGAIAGGELVAFIFARRWIKAVYEPRTYIPIREEQAVVLGKNLLAPLWKIITGEHGSLFSQSAMSNGEGKNTDDATVQRVLKRSCIRTESIHMSLSGS